MAPPPCGIGLMKLVFEKETVESILTVAESFYFVLFSQLTQLHSSSCFTLSTAAVTIQCYQLGVGTPGCYQFGLSSVT